MDHTPSDHAVNFAKLLNDYGELNIAVDMPLATWLQVMDHTLVADREAGDDLAAAVAEGVNEHFQGEAASKLASELYQSRGGCGNFDLLDGGDAWQNN